MRPSDDEIHEEIAAHLRMAIADRMARGPSREKAERTARAEFGNVTHVAEVTREMRGGLWLERLGQDLRYGWRALRRTPAFTLVAVLTLALAIGANSAVFTVVDSVLLQPLPFRDPGRLYAVSYLPTNLPFELPPGLDDRLYLEYRRHDLRFERVTGYQRQELTLSGVGDATRVPGARASATFFAVLGVHPALGRGFTPEEDEAGNDRVVILSDRLWRARFNGDPAILGKTITLDGITRTIVGVMPRGFTFPAASQLWTPLALRLDPGNSFIFPVVGRLRADATPEQAKSELVLIALLGGTAGIIVAFGGVHALLAIAPAGRIPRIDEVHLNGWVLGFTLTVSLVTGILFGVVPARSGARREPREALGHGMRLVGGPQRRLRAGFVTGEIALALVLMTGAGLMIKSFLVMRSLDTRYDGSRVVTLAVDLPPNAYADATRIRAFHTQLLERLARIPGVDAVGAVSFRPMAGMGIMGNFSVEGPTPLPHGYSVDKPTVSPGYFGALGIRTLAGRDFTPADRAGAPGVVVVSQLVARRVWPGQDAVGKRISMQDDPGPNDWLTVIGGVNDVVQDEQLTRHSTIYLPYLQTTWTGFINHMTYVIRPAPGALQVAPAMRAALREVDRAVPAQALQTMDQSMLDTIAEPVFQMRLLTAFALLALLLAALGTYGVLAYDVTERTREIGLRLALGATPGNVLRMVLGRTAALALAGALLGLGGALVLTRVLTKSLFEVKPTDPVTLVAVTVVLVLVALVAGFFPAQRATRIRALVALLQD